MRTSEEMQELFDGHKHLIEATIRRKGYGQKKFLENHGIVPDDLIQHGRLGLHKACKEHNSTKKSSFRTFAIDNIGWSISTECKKESLSRDTSWTFDTIDKVSFDSPAPECEAEVATFHDVVGDLVAEEFYNKLEKEQIMNSLGSIISKRVAEIVELKLQGFNNMEVADKLGVSHQSISRYLRNHKQEIKNVLLV